MSNHARQLFDALLRNQPVAARTSFESGIRQKIQDALELKKVEVAHGVFNESKEDAEKMYQDASNMRKKRGLPPVITKGSHWQDARGNRVTVKQILPNGEVEIDYGQSGPRAHISAAELAYGGGVYRGIDQYSAEGL